MKRSLQRRFFIKVHKKYGTRPDINRISGIKVLQIFYDKFDSVKRIETNQTTRMFLVTICRVIMLLTRFYYQPCVEHVIVPTFVTKVTEHLCSGSVFFFRDKFRLFN